MKNIDKLIVKAPVASLGKGDVLEYDKDTNLYTLAYSDTADGVTSYNEISLSPAIAQHLIDEDTLEVYTEPEKANTNFVNIFDELDNLKERFTTCIANLDKDYKNLPDCMKAEAKAVYTNQLSLVEHLQSLKR